MTTTVDPGRTARQRVPHHGDEWAQRIRAALERLAKQQPVVRPDPEPETKTQEWR